MLYINHFYLIKYVFNVEKILNFSRLILVDNKISKFNIRENSNHLIKTTQHPIRRTIYGASVYIRQTHTHTYRSAFL